MAWLPSQPVSYAVVSSATPATPRGTTSPANDPIWLVTAVSFIIIVTLFGGSPRPEVVTLPLLRGAAVFVAVLGISGLVHRQLWHASGAIALLAGFLVALPLAQLVPLPPGMTASLAGRGILAEIDAVMGSAPTWRPLTMSPLGTMNALLAATVPLAALILGLNVQRSHHRHLAKTFLGIGLVSLCLGLGQMLATNDSALFFFETTNRGSPVGLFANRNHHAVFLACLIVLAPLALTRGLRSNAGRAGEVAAGLKAAAVVLACLWIAGMALLTGSRSGALAAALALLGVPVLLIAQSRALQSASLVRPSAHAPLRGLLMIAGLGLIIPFTMWIERAPALDRWLGTDPDTEGRLRLMPQVLELSWLYWPWGSGAGSFEKVFQIHETETRLSPAYMNHAHNDVLEVIMTGGAAGLAFILCGVIGWLVLAFRAFVIGRADSLQPLRQAGVMITGLLALASLVDYPLRTPALAVLFVFAWIWAALPVSTAAPPGGAKVPHIQLPERPR